MEHQLALEPLLKIIKIKRLRKQHVKNVELDPTLTHVIWNGLEIV